MPRSIYAMAALTLVAASLFGLRYGLTRSLDLHPPLARILQQTFGYTERTEEAKNTRKPPRPEAASPDENQAVMQDEDQQNAAQQPNQSEESSDPSDGAETAKDDNNSDGGKKRAIRPSRPRATTRTGRERIRGTATPLKMDSPARIKVIRNRTVNPMPTSLPTIPV